MVEETITEKCKHMIMVLAILSARVWKHTKFQWFWIGFAAGAGTVLLVAFSQRLHP